MTSIMPASPEIFQDLDADEAHKELAQKQDHNAQLPISRLPVEILLEIFIIFIHSNIPIPTYPDYEYDIPEFHRVIRDLRSICSVCSRWRAAAVGCPALWSYISLRHRSCALEFVRRAKGVPVTILELEARWDAAEELLHQILSGSCRVKQVTLPSFTRNIYAVMPSILSHSSTLEVLRFHPHIHPAVSQIDLESLDMVSLFSLPNLRQLDISSHDLNWKSDYPIRAISLTSLRLEHTSNSICEKLLEVLQMTTELASLIVLEQLGSRPIFPISEEGPIAQLDKLVSLRIETYFPHCRAFLSRLRYPPSATIEVTVINWYDAQTSVEGLRIKEFITLCGLNSASFARHLEVKTTFEEFSLMSLSLWDTTASYLNDNAFPYRNRATKPRTVVRFEDFLDHPTLIRAMIPHMFFPNVQQLTWSADDDETGCDELCEFARRIPGVKEMAIFGCQTIQAYRTLFCTPQSPGSKRRSNLKFFPSLTFLQLTDVDFGYHEDDVEEMRALCQILKYRKKYRAKLQCLYLKDCYCVDDRVISELREQNHSNQVVWDGIEQGFSEDYISPFEDDDLYNSNDILMGIFDDEDDEW